jgi:hypothetical protein
MHSTNGQARDNLVSAVIEAVATIRPDAPHVDGQTRLSGTGALLDSVGLVSLLINLEQRLDNAVDLASSLMESANVPEDKNPFQTVGSLADHIHRLLATPA